jgi:hypothetical protein
MFTRNSLRINTCKSVCKQRTLTGIVYLTQGGVYNAATMHSAIKKRLSSWAELFRGKVMWFVAAAWTLLGGFDLVKAELLPEKYASYTALHLFRYVSWRTWLIVFLFLLIGVVLEGGHKAIQAREEKLIAADERIDGEQKKYLTLSNALQRVQGPKVHLLWDVPKDFASLGKRENRLIIENASDVDAYHVKIQDVSIDRNKVVSATFSEINVLRKNSKMTVDLRIVGNVQPEYVNDFEMIYANTQDIPEEYKFVDESGYHLLKFPLFVNYQEYDGKIDFKSEFLFTFDLTTMGLHDGIEFIRCEKAVMPHPAL